MPRYNYRCISCNALIEVDRSYSDPGWDMAPPCCSMPMRRDYSSENTGFIPGDGMYSKENRK